MSNCVYPGHIEKKKTPDERLDNSRVCGRVRNEFARGEAEHYHTDQQLESSGGRPTTSWLISESSITHEERLTRHFQL